MLLKTLTLSNQKKTSAPNFYAFNAKRWFSLFALFLLIGQLHATELSSTGLLKDAITKRQIGKHQQAIDILEKLRVQFTTHKRINIELVINHIKLHQYDHAENIIVQLQSMSLSEKEAQKLQTLQNLIDKQSKKTVNKHQYSVELKANIGTDTFTSDVPVYYYDDDYGLGGASEIICYDYYEGDTYIGTECYEGDNLIDNNGFESDGFDDEEYNPNRELEKSKDKQTYSNQSIRINYRYRPQEKFKLFGQPTSLILSNNLVLLQKQIRHHNDRKYSQIKLDSTMYLLQKNRWMFDARLQGIYHYSDGKKILSDQGIQLSTTMPFNKSRLKFAWEYKNKSYHSQLSDNNGHVSTPRVEYAIKFNHYLRFSVGSRYLQYRAKDEYNSYNNLNFYLGLHFYPSQNLTTFVTLNHNKLHYLVDDPELVNWAEEVKRSVALGIKYKFNQNISMGLNSHFVTNKIENDFGQDDWNRVEAFISYQF
jgi:hypothetical protein